jgi:5-methylcytosine-specific restriction enzyme A
MAWETSTRRQQLPSDWRKRRARALRRDTYHCQHPGCPHQDPTGHTLEVDHINGRHDHRLPNLQTLCAEHHKAKTLAERQPPRRRPDEPHPGLTR